MNKTSIVFLQSNQEVKIPTQERKFSVMSKADYEIYVKLNSKNADGTYSYTL